MNRDSQAELDAYFSGEKKVRRLGLENAKLEYPPTDSKAFDKPQTDLKLDAGRIAAKVKGDADATLHGLAGELSKNENDNLSKALLVGIGAEFTNCKARITSLINAARNELTALKRTCLETQKYLEIFKRKHNINRQPKSVPSKQAHYLWITFYAIVEVIANIFFFNIGFNAPDALAIAVLLAAINLLISVAAGNFWRNKNSLGVDRHVANGVFVLWLIFVIWFNTATAITRSVMVAGGVKLGGAVQQAFFHDSWRIFVLSAPNIADLMSVLLWIAGAAVAAFAFFEGYRSEDPIPGYTEHSDAVKRVCADYKNAENSLRSTINSDIGTVQSRFDEYRRIIRDSLAQFNTNRGVLIRELKQAQMDHVSVNTAFVQLINSYREENHYRKSDLPEYFSVEPKLDGVAAAAPERCSEEELKGRAEHLNNESNARLIEIANQRSDFTEKSSVFPQLIEDEVKKMDRSARDAMEISIRSESGK